MRGATRTKPTKATVCRRALGTRSLSGRHDNERLTSARGVSAIGKQARVFERAPVIDIDPNTQLGERCGGGARKIESRCSPRRQAADPRHRALTRRGHVRGHLVASSADSRTDEGIHRTVNDSTYALRGTSEYPSEEPTPARVDSSDNPPGCGRENDRQTVRGLHGETRSIRASAGINDDPVSIDGSPLPRCWLLKRIAALRAPGNATAHPQELDPSRVRLIHPNDVASQRIRKSAPTFAHEGRIIPHMQSDIATKRTGARVHLGEVDPGTGPSNVSHQRRKGGISSSSFSGASG